MADPHDDPALVEAMVLPSAGRQGPDPPDTNGGGMKKEQENETSHYRESPGRNGDGEVGVKVASPRLDCIQPAANSQDCAPGGTRQEEENADHSAAGCGGYSNGGVLGSDALGVDSGGIPGEICEVEVARLAPELVLAASDETPVLVEAERDGEWFKAIEARDCLSLMNILKAQVDDAARVSLSYKSGEQRRTALHVAAMQGCFRLAKQLIDLVREEYPFFNSDYYAHGLSSRDGSSYDVYDLSSTAVDYIYGKDGRSELSAYEMANDIIGNTSISQYILYVGPNQKDTEYSGMYEAYEGTQWHTALAQGDCHMLKSLLECNSRWLLETCGGLSVLDVAILKGDEELVERVVSMFRLACDGPSISWHQESYFPSELKWEQIAERSLSVEFAKMDCFPSVKSRKNLQFVGSALELAEKFGRSEEIKELLQNVANHGRRSKKVYVNQGRIQRLLTSLSSVGFFENGFGSRPQMNGKSNIELEALESELPEFEKLMELVESIEIFWKSEWTTGFMADVDYNFEDKRSLRLSMLRLHYAFKHPQQCESFVFNIWNTCNSDYILSMLWDGQGRTIFHLLVDHYHSKNCSFDEWKRLPFTSNNLDSRGRSALMRAITKQFLEQDTMVSSHLLQHFEYHQKKLNKTLFGDIPNKYDLEKKYIVKSIAFENLRDCAQNNKISMFHWLFMASFIFEDANVLRSFLSEEKCENEIEAFLKRVHLDPSHDGINEISFLFIAAALGNQMLLRECFKFKFDCMVEDAKGRTALHYAANGNLLKFISPPTSFFCSIDYPKKVEEEWTKRRKAEKGNSNVGPHINGNPQSNASVGRKACILMLLQEGVDLSQVDKRGNIPDPDTSSDAEFQSWWYSILVKDSEDKKNSFNQAGNALSVVGTLVAATSYIGPLQPPLNYATHDGYVDTSRSLVKVFIWANTLAFYLAVASVMFAVVPSLPMPQEGVLDELRRARHTVSSSLFLLLASIGCILVSFAAATAVVIDNGDYYGANDFLLSPSVIGWCFCLIAMVSFFVRMMRLVFFRNSTIRHIYKFSLNVFLKRSGKTVQSVIARNYRRVIGIPVPLLLIVPICLLEFGLIWMIFSMGRGLRRLWKARIRHRELGRPTAQEEDSPELPIGPIWKLGAWLISDWMD